MAKRLIVRLLVVGFMVTPGWAVGPVLATDQDKEQGDRNNKDKDRDHFDPPSDRREQVWLFRPQPQLH